MSGTDDARMRADMSDDFDRRAAEAEVRRNSLPELVRLVMHRDAHLYAILNAWICSGHVPVNVADMIEASHPGMVDGPGPEMRPGSVEDVLAYALVGMVANKQALISAMVAAKMREGAPATS